MNRFWLLIVVLVTTLFFPATYARRSSRGHMVKDDLWRKQNFIRRAFFTELQDNSVQGNPEEFFKKAGFELTKCKAEQRIEKLDLPRKDGAIYFPTCVKVSKCAGCCVGMRACRPLSAEDHIIQVLEVQAPSHSSITRNHINNGTFIYRLVRQESNCTCQCDPPEESCNKGTHMFNRMDCTCICKNIEEKKSCESSGLHRWDNHDCNCQCKHPRECSSSQVFDKSICECVAIHRNVEMEKLINRIFHGR